MHLVVQYMIYSTRGVVSCCKSRTALRERINYNGEKEVQVWPRVQVS